MDKLDNKIRQSKEASKHRANFVESVMESLPDEKKKVVLGSFAKIVFFGGGLVILIAIAFAGANKFSAIKKANHSTSNNQTLATTQLTPGTTNNNLASDLSSVSQSINASKQSLSSLDAAINDNQNQISVPQN